MHAFSHNRLDELVANIRSLESDIRGLGVDHLQIVGSWADGSATIDSDLDVLARFKSNVSASYFKLAEVQILLEARLELRIDVLLESAFIKNGLRFTRWIDVF